MEILPLRVGVGKFFFTEGCIAFLPEEIHRLGPKALMIGGPNSMPALIEHLPDGWNSGLEIIREVYAGACSVNQAYAFAEQAMTEGCSVVVGVGGGRCIDLAKAVSVIAGIDIITVPTSLATCAASSAICVMYHDDGRADHSINMKKEVDVCIADPKGFDDCAETFVGIWSDGFHGQASRDNASETYKQLQKLFSQSLYRT